MSCCSFVCVVVWVVVVASCCDHELMLLVAMALSLSLWPVSPLLFVVSGVCVGHCELLYCVCVLCVVVCCLTVCVVTVGVTVAAGCHWLLDSVRCVLIVRGACVFVRCVCCLSRCAVSVCVCECSVACIVGLRVGFSGGMCVWFASSIVCLFGVC